MNKKILLPLCVLVAFAPGVEAACASNIPQYSSKRFVDNGDGTVTDTALKLIWMQCELGARWDTNTKACVSNLNDHPRIRVQWKEALLATEDFNRSQVLLQLPTWRMPNIKELGSLINYACLNNQQIGIDPSVFPTAVADVWSNTPGAMQRSNGATPPVMSNTAWMVSFNYGKLLDDRIDDPRVTHHIRLMREAR